jgi:hypothetical protein
VGAAGLGRLGRGVLKGLLFKGSHWLCAFSGGIDPLSGGVADCG